MRYRLIDYYEGEPELICESDSMAEINMAAAEWEAETDGECELHVEEDAI